MQSDFFALFHIPLLQLTFVIGSVAIAFPVVGEEIHEFQKIVAGDGALGDEFGYSVSVSGGNSISGAYRDDDNGNNAGAAYLFRQNGLDSWSEVAKLTASDGAPNDWFGSAVGISGHAAVIGARGDDDRGMFAGSAYIFSDDGSGTWSQAAKLIANNGMENDYFGSSVAIDGDTVVVGALNHDGKAFDSGSAYLFRKDNSGVWRRNAELRATDAAQYDHFGSTVAISGDMVLIGASGAEAAYLFRDNGTAGWSQIAKLNASDSVAGDSFGYSVAISGNTAIVGAFADDDHGSGSGSAYIFRDNGSGTWSQIAKLSPNEGAIADSFGWSVAIDGNRVVVGSFFDDGEAINSGSAYVYNEDTSGIWKQFAKLTASDAQREDWFGYSVAISDTTALVGSRLEDRGGSNLGAAYLFRVVPEPYAVVLAGFIGLGLAGSRLRLAEFSFQQKQNTLASVRSRAC